MATATLGLLGHTEIDDADTNTSWSGTTTADADIKKEGTASMSGVVRSDLDVAYYDDSTARSIAGEHLRVWVNTINTPYMEDEAGGGYELYVFDGTNTDYYTIFGSDTYPGGWFNAVVDCSLFTTVTDANVDRWGIRANHTSNGKNAVNTWIDYFRYMDGYYITGGTTGDKVRLSDVATADKGTTTLYGYGITEEFEDVYFGSGEIQLGNGATTTYFEMDGDVLVFTDKPVADGLYAINGNGSGADILIVNSTIKASGTGDNNRPDIDMVTDSPGTVSIVDTVFIRGGTFDFTSGQTITGCTFNDCEQITPGGADLTESAVQGYEGTAGTAALLYDVNADPDGELDNMYFEKGAATTHAIQFDATNTPTTITLRGIDFSGYNGSNGQNDSTLYFPSTTKSYTVNLVGCTGNVSYRVGTGGSVSLVSDPVTTGVTVYDGGTSPPTLLSGARVLVYCSEYVSGAGFPYQESVTITGSGTTATVDHTGHGLATNDNVVIRGANEDVYNGAYQITVSDVDTYTYTTNETIGTTPATGTITSTFAFINTTTDGSGYASDSRVVGDDQPIIGWVRKSSSSPYFQQGDIVGSVDSVDGVNFTIQMSRDE